MEVREYYIIGSLDPLAVTIIRYSQDLALRIDESTDSTGVDQSITWRLDLLKLLEAIGVIDRAQYLTLGDLPWRLTDTYITCLHIRDKVAANSSPNVRSMNKVELFLGKLRQTLKHT